MDEAITIRSVLNTELIDLHLIGTTKQEVLKEMVDMLFQQQKISNKEIFLEDVYQREEEGITGIGDQIAIPHGKSDAVIHTAVAIGRSDHDLEWNSIDHKPVRLVIMLAIKSLDKTIHIRLLSKVATSLCNPQIVGKMLICEDKNTIIQLLEQEGGNV